MMQGNVWLEGTPSRSPSTLRIPAWRAKSLRRAISRWLCAGLHFHDAPLRAMSPQRTCRRKWYRFVIRVLRLTTTSQQMRSLKRQGCGPVGTIAVSRRHELGPGEICPSARCGFSRITKDSAFQQKDPAFQGLPDQTKFSRCPLCLLMSPRRLAKGFPYSISTWGHLFISGITRMRARLSVHSRRIVEKGKAKTYPFLRLLHHNAISRAISTCIPHDESSICRSHTRGSPRSMCNV
ncbi:hypothetical protein IQ07DRAFT_180357 [Pyrenochaeta sp. DS3sAY3a]|nr:hypothetical protein IQ07DRAFT_180357 [Pyrenochaeta sp. DS3sAY3a]